MHTFIRKTERKYSTTRCWKKQFNFIVVWKENQSNINGAGDVDITSTFIKRQIFYIYNILYGSFYFSDILEIFYFYSLDLYIVCIFRKKAGVLCIYVWI